MLYGKSSDLDHKTKFEFCQAIPLKHYLARLKDAMATEDESTTHDLLYNFRLSDHTAFRIGGERFHVWQSSRKGELP